MFIIIVLKHCCISSVRIFYLHSDNEECFVVIPRYVRAASNIIIKVRVAAENRKNNARHTRFSRSLYNNIIIYLRARFGKYCVRRGGVVARVQGEVPAVLSGT